MKIYSVVPRQIRRKKPQRTLFPKYVEKYSPSNAMAQVIREEFTVKMTNRSKTKTEVKTAVNRKPKAM